MGGTCLLSNHPQPTSSRMNLARAELGANLWADSLSRRNGQKPARAGRQLLKAYCMGE